MKDKLYFYQANIIKVYDGDTVTADIDIGMGVWIRGEKLRLHRINAPEVRGAEKVEGKISRDFLRELILDKEVFVETIRDKRGKYGRYLAEIWLEGSEGNWSNINDALVANGQAVYKDY